MAGRFLISSLAAVLVGAMASSAAAQSQGWVRPPAELPSTPSGKRWHDLDFLFGALKAATDEVAAKAVEQRIWARWLASGSDTTTLLMSRVKIAIEAKDTDLALRLLDAVVELDPGYVEGWNRRATLRFLRKEYAEAMADIRRVLALEPRHFGALAGLGVILQEFGDDKRALQAFRRALEINPHLERIPDAVKSLTESVEGRDI